jgi:hypothetical protein
MNEFNFLFDNYLNNINLNDLSPKGSNIETEFDYTVIKDHLLEDILPTINREDDNMK